MSPLLFRETCMTFDCFADYNDLLNNVIQISKKTHLNSHVSMKFLYSHQI